MTNPQSGGERWTFWIDRGGTFTDIIGVDGAGVEHTRKLLSASPSYEDAAVEGMRRMLELGEDAPFPADRVAAIKMGTTVATNALLERKGARTLFVTTQGFGDSVLIGDQARPELFALTMERAAPLYAGVAEASERLTMKVFDSCSIASSAETVGYTIDGDPVEAIEPVEMHITPGALTVLSPAAG